MVFRLSMTPSVRKITIDSDPNLVNSAPVNGKFIKSNAIIMEIIFEKKFIENAETRKHAGLLPLNRAMVENKMLIITVKKLTNKSGLNTNE